MIEIIATGSWVPKQFQDNFGESAIHPLQVTKVKMTDYNCIVYVRENVKLPESGFSVSSTERWGMKKRGCVPKGSKQVLEVIIDSPQSQSIMDEIKHADPLHREIVTNRMFTREWAEKNLIP